jgi:hypothetical protein
LRAKDSSYARGLAMPSRIDDVRHHIEDLLRDEVIARVESTFGAEAAAGLTEQISGRAQELAEQLTGDDPEVTDSTGRLLMGLFDTIPAPGLRIRTPLGVAIMSTWDPSSPLIVEEMEHMLGLSRSRIYQLLDNGKLEETSSPLNDKDRRCATTRSVIARMRMQQAQAAVFTAIGHQTDLRSARNLQVVLYDELGLPPADDTYPTDTDALLELHRRTGHTVLEHILEYRALTTERPNKTPC